MLAGLKNLLCDEYDKSARLKRGGGEHLFSLDAQPLEARYRLEPADPEDPERAFDQRWALAMLGQVLTRLEREHEQAGKGKPWRGLRCRIGRAAHGVPKLRRL